MVVTKYLLYVTKELMVVAVCVTDLFFVHRNSWQKLQMFFSDMMKECVNFFAFVIRDKKCRCIVRIFWTYIFFACLLVTKYWKFFGQVID